MLNLMTVYTCPAWCSSVQPNMVYMWEHETKSWLRNAPDFILIENSSLLYNNALILEMDREGCKIWEICWHCGVRDIHTLNTLWHTRFSLEAISSRAQSMCHSTLGLLKSCIYTSSKPLSIYLSFCFSSSGINQCYSELKEQKT